MRCWIVLFFCLASSVANAQTVLCSSNKKAISLYVEADNYRVRGQFKQAVELLNQAIQKDKNFCEAYHRMGLVYKGMREHKKAIEWMNKALALTSDTKKQKPFHFDLADLYLHAGDYTQVREHAAQFLGQEKTNKRMIEMATLWLRTSEYSLQNTKSFNQYQPRLLSDTVNCFAMQYFPVLTADEQQLFFTKRNGSRDSDTEDLVVSLKDAHGGWGQPTSVSENINTIENEGTCTVSADGRQLIFTSCRGRAGLGGCDLFMSVKEGDVWSEPVNLGPGINSPYWESQPTLSADGRTLYFSSERKGGRGGKDIYVSYKNDRGVWSRAALLPASINSAKDDVSPFIHANGRTLFFASNGRIGFGGFDIFVTERIDGIWSEPKNFGAPVNNHEDQFSLFITADGARGFYSHERDFDENSSRIYEITLPEELQLAHNSNYVKGFISDEENGRPIKANIELHDLKKNELISIVSSDSLNGKYLMVLTYGSDYGLFVSAPGYLYKSFNFNYVQLQQREPIHANIELQPVKTGARVVLNNIFFDYNKFDVKPESITELEKVIRFLMDNPKLTIEISGHTDNQGNEANNITLSQNRAVAIVTYLIDHGIAKQRIKNIGHGSKKPLVDNLTEENRALNRRIEFRILE